MPGSSVLEILGMWEGWERRRSRRTGREVGSETWEVARGALKLYCHTGSCCWSAGSVLEEGLPPSSVSLVSMTMMTRKRSLTVEVDASEAGGLPRQPLGGDGTLMDGEEEGKAQSHLGEVGSSRVMSRREEVGRGEVGEEGMGIQRADGAGLFAAPGAPTGGLPSSASPAWGAEQGRQRNLLKETQLLMRSWTRYQFEELGQIY